MCGTKDRCQILKAYQSRQELVCNPSSDQARIEKKGRNPAHAREETTLNTFPAHHKHENLHSITISVRWLSWGDIGRPKSSPASSLQFMTNRVRSPLVREALPHASATPESQLVERNGGQVGTLYKREQILQESGLACWVMGQEQHLETYK